MIDYLIKLKPLTPFFFGGEDTLGEGTETNYMAKSNYLPQQTTLLGLIRYELLVQNELIGKNPHETKWANYIGAKSFMKENETYTTDFGAIDSLSPVFLIEKNIHYFPQAMDWAMYEENKNKKSDDLKNLKVAPLDLQFEVNENLSSQPTEADYKIPNLTVNNSTYNPKHGLKQLWVSEDGKTNRQQNFEDLFESDRGFENGFFVEKKQVGIHRQLSKSKNEIGDFYKQHFLQFSNQDTCFAFYLRLDKAKAKNFSSRITAMGGERSMFEMEVIPRDSLSDSFHKIYNDACLVAYRISHPSRTHAIILTSDTFCSPEILKHCHFSITDSIPFRNITTKQEENGNYVALSRNNDRTMNKTKELLYLLKRGSILYPKEDFSCNFIEDWKAFQKIGYNQFITIK